MSHILLVTPSTEFEQQVRDALGQRAEGAVERAEDQVMLMDAARAAETLLLAEGPPPDVIAIGPGLPTDVALRLAEALDVRAPDASLILVADPGPDLYERAMRAGVRDVVAREAEAEDLRVAFEKAEQAAARRRAAHGDVPSQHAPTGRVIVVMSPKGGTGKTTIATNLATELAQRDAQTVLVDLDLQFGDAASALQLLPEHTISDVAGDVNRIDVTGLKVLLTKHESGLYVLCAPSSPVEGEQVPPSTGEKVLRLLASDFRHVVVDTGSGLNEHTLAALEVATDLVLVCSMDVPSVQGFRKTIVALDQIGMTHQARHVVLNRADARVGLDTDDIERTVGVPINVELPSSRSVPLSVNRGVPVVTSEPRAHISGALRGLADRFVRSDRGSARQPGLFERLKGQR